jgi:hypothetical protein
VARCEWQQVCLHPLHVSLLQLCLISLLSLLFAALFQRNFLYPKKGHQTPIDRLRYSLLFSPFCLAPCVHDIPPYLYPYVCLLANPFNEVFCIPPYNINPFLFSFLATRDDFFWSSRDLLSSHGRATGSPSLSPPCPILFMSYANVFVLVRQLSLRRSFFLAKKVVCELALLHGTTLRFSCF